MVHARIKNIIVGLSILLQVNAFTQLVDYAPVFLDNCDQSMSSDWWYIVDSENIKIKPESGKVILDLNRNYFLVSAALKSEPTEINLSSSSAFLDTFYLSKLTIKYPKDHFSWNQDYYCCDSLIDGDYVEYFNNAKVRYNGRFDNGKLEDTLMSYYQTGELKSIKIVLSGQIVFKDYFKSGQLRTDVKTNVKYRYYYYESGALKSKVHNKKNINLEYFSDGSLRASVRLKNEEIYHSNGKLIGQLTKEKYRLKDRLRLNKEKVNYLYTWTDFDTTGVKTREIVFKCTEYYSLFTGSIYQCSYDNFLWVDYFNGNERIVNVSRGFYEKKERIGEDCWIVYKLKEDQIISKEEFELTKIRELIEKYDLEFK